MRIFSWTLGAILILAIGLLLHYSLPGRDIVRVTGQEVKREDTELQLDDGSTVTQTRDVNRVFAVTPQGRAVTFRNEDTDWGWPPYFKFDTADVSAEAANFASSEADPRWVVVRHYGWRIQMLSMFPNIVSIRPAESVDEPLYPWFNGIVIALLVVAGLLIRRMLRIFYRRHVDPVVDAIDEGIDSASDTVAAKRRGIGAFFGRLFGR